MTTHQLHLQFVREVAEYLPQSCIVHCEQMTESWGLYKAERLDWQKLALEIQGNLKQAAE